MVFYLGLSETGMAILEANDCVTGGKTA